MENMIAIGKLRSRKSSKLEQVKIPWSVFAKRLLKVERTHETQAEFFQKSHDEQTAIKDKGGYLAGISKDGTRGKDAIVSRSCAVLSAPRQASKFEGNKVEQLGDGNNIILYRWLV